MSAGDWPTGAKLGGFALAVAALFAGTYAVGAAVGPDMTPPPPAAASAAAGGHGGHSAAGAAAPGAEVSGVAEAPAAKGLAVSQDGYTLETLAAPAAANTPGELAFRVLGPAGTPVTAFTPTHDKALHLIVVRRDLAGFQHVHPAMDPAGTWRIPMTFAPGDYRVFADFAPDGRTEAMTLGRDLAVPGQYQPVPLPAPAPVAAIADGYTVALDGTLVPGRSSPVSLSVFKDGRPVTDLQPYLAAYGHLVALREGDLAYLHVHPEGMPGDGRTPPGPQIGFAAEVPTAAPYRLFLDFQHQGVVRTAEFTATATATGPTPQPGATPAGGHGADGHGH